MVWTAFNPPVVPSLEDFPPEEAKRLTRICITHLIMHRQNWIKEKMRELEIESPRQAIEFVIREINYPFTFGKPDDSHIFSFFTCKASWWLRVDYWQTAEETLMTYVLNKKLYNKRGYGDCEDTSILLTAMLRILGAEAYTVFGVVKRRDQVLGGHGWTITKLEDGKWRLIETTLDDPLPYPYGYPEIDPNENEWAVGEITYEAWIKFNETSYYEWRSTMSSKLVEYVRIRKKEKETRRKYEAISISYRTDVKPLRRQRRINKILSRIRWRS